MLTLSGKSWLRRKKMIRIPTVVRIGILMILLLNILGITKSILSLGFFPLLQWKYFKIMEINYFICQVNEIQPNIKR